MIQAFGLIFNFFNIASRCGDMSIFRVVKIFEILMKKNIFFLNFFLFFRMTKLL
jgi:hypothetical protein